MDIQSSNATLSNALPSNVHRIATAALFEEFVRINKPYFDQLEAYINGEYDQALIQDLSIPRIVAQELSITKGYLYWLIKHNHIPTYTEANLVRRSEVRAYIEASNDKPNKRGPKARR